MTTAPAWDSPDNYTCDLLALVAEGAAGISANDADTFLAACEADAADHLGLVSVNRVRARLAASDIDPRRYSSFWANFTGKDRPMRKTGEWETCAGSTSGNDGRPFPIRRWVQ